MGLVKWTRGVRELFVGERERIVTWLGGRAYVEFRGVRRDQLDAFVTALAELTEGHGHILGVQVNPLTRRVAFRIGTTDPSPAYLVALVQTAERRVLAEPLAIRVDDDARVLPDDLALDRELSIEAMADAAALLSSVLLRIVPFVPRRLGTNLHGLLFLVSQTDRLRRPLDERLGRERADFFLRLALASAQGLSQRPLSALVDLGERLVALRELRERRALFRDVGRELAFHDRESGLIEAPLPRETPLPKGPIERYADRAWGVALGSFAVSLATTRSPSRAVAAGFSALPQPARLGRELFVSELGRVFARHRMLVLSREALRRLDRVDTLVVPAELMTREQFLVADAFALDGIDRQSAMLAARQLFSAERPLRVSDAEGFTLGPARLVAGPFAPAREAAMREREARGALVLALAREGAVVALVEVQIFPEVRVSEALRAARKLGMRLVVSTDDPQSAEPLHTDEVVGTGEALRAALVRLAGEGRTTMFVGRGASPGYAAADVSIALCKSGEETPWGAHVLCPDDSRALSLAVEAVSVARGVSEQSVRLGMGAAAFGTLASAGGRANLAARRVMFVVNAASLVAMLDAFRRTHLVEQSTAAAFDPTPWHALSAEGVLHRLSHGESGLAKLPPEAPGSRLTALRELGAAVQKELENPLSPLLALGAGISAMVGSVADAGIVAAVGGVNAFVGGYQRYKTERAIHELTARARPRVRVQRGGRTLSVQASELVRGDIVELLPGDVVPADCRILSASALEVDASSLTGESFPVPKSSAPSFAENPADLSCMLHEGTSIAAGSATAIVVAIGDDTLSRRGLAGMSSEQRGGVEARLRDLMRLTGPFAVSAGAALVAAGLLRGRRVDDLVSTGVGLAVAAVPEGLPVLATAAQLATAERLSRRGALVKNPRAIEALGRVDVLCMDKTGTLTEGLIDLHLVHDGQGGHLVAEASAPVAEVVRTALDAVARGRGERVDPLDAAIVTAGRRLFGPTPSLALVRIAECPFEATRGFEAVLGRAEAGLLLCVKGAPERLFARAHPAEAERVAALSVALDALAGRGLRVLAVARAELDDGALAERGAEAMVQDPQGLRLVGLLAFRDPARAQAGQALQDLARAKVRVVMITGDHPATAHALASEVGLADAARVLTGVELAAMGDAELDAAVTRTGVFARMSPAQKVRVVRALQRVGSVVGMVGDGANDAPAMRAADAAIAVGPRSTEAARAAADIVLADAQIEAIVETIVHGRAMWSTVRDAVSILVGGNLGEIGFTVGVGALTGRSPLSPRQLLLVNFLTDIAPSMAIALRPPTSEELSSLRFASPEEALGGGLDRDIVARAISTSFGAGGAWLFARLTGGAARARTVGLVGLVGSQLGQTLLHGGRDRSVMWTSLASLGLLGVIVQTPGVSQLFGCRPLGPVAWTTGLVASAAATAASPLVERAVGSGFDVVNVLAKELDALGLLPASLRPKEKPALPAAEG